MGDPFTAFYEKLKKVKNALAIQRRDSFGNTFQKVATLEDEVNVKEIQFEINPFVKNREELNRTNAELKKY